MDTTLTDNIVNAFQALALDEHRAPFSPAVWEKPEGCETNLKQVWFPGAHSGVGGGYDDAGSANISLAWMMDQLSGNSGGYVSCKDQNDWIEFRPDYLAHLDRLNNEWYETNPPSKLWGNGALIKSFQFPMSLAGWIKRTPGRYRRMDHVTCKADHGDFLRDTNEYIHASVRARMDLGGEAPVDDPKTLQIWSLFTKIVHMMLGRGGKAAYRPAALKDWNLRDGHDYHDEVAVCNVQLVQQTGGAPWWEWAGQATQVPGNRRLYEDRLGKYELLLLESCDVGEEIEASNRGLNSVATLRRTLALEREMMERETVRSRTI
jgi:hypothetical protein